MPAVKKLKVMFLCTGNSCRSQMAEGFARRLKGAVIEPYSAGIEKHGMNSRAMQVMAEAGVPIDNQYSKTVAELPTLDFDYVVSVCGHANESCPVFPGKTRVIHVGFDDPPKLAKDARGATASTPRVWWPSTACSRCCSIASTRGCSSR